MNIQVVRRGSGNVILLRSADSNAVLQIRAKLLDAILRKWKHKKDGWFVDLVKNNSLIEDSITLLQSSKRIESTELISDLKGFSEQIQCLLDVNNHLSEMFE